MSGVSLRRRRIDGWKDPVENPLDFGSLIDGTLKHCWECAGRRGGRDARPTLNSGDTDVRPTRNRCGKPRWQEPGSNVSIMYVSAEETQANLDEGRIVDVVMRYWGYSALRPLQAEAIRAGVEQRDSVVVMPTGGGKSLCYQVPPAMTGRTDVVVSPLIALMKDQVDGLRQCGYPAAALHSGMSIIEKREIGRAVRAGDVHLLFVAPERLVKPEFLDWLERVGVRSFAIDEAHCISHWGHDFRTEYRRLAMLKGRFPQASMHAYTATATQRVRDDIAAQLKLVNPTMLVGRFDRPNLIYRVVERVDQNEQVLEVVRRHANQAVIVYCITRAETEGLASFLGLHGVRAACYHAGLEPEVRRETQERFAREELDVIVATVAFGMGIDRSDVRCVIHAAMPKSVEHYQQETGRAGRDGLEAECVLLYSPADGMRWQRLIERSAEQADDPVEVSRAMQTLLGHMRGFATGNTCRHKLLSEYFGQVYGRDKCGACDVCLGEVTTEVVGDPRSLALAQKVLSCVARVEQRFGLGHVVKVLTGSREQRIHSFGHDRLSTFGLLRDMDSKTLSWMIYQLVDQGLLDRTHSDRPLLKLNAASREVLDGTRPLRLAWPKQRVVKATRMEADAWEGVDRALFEKLRELRRQIAAESGVPPFVVFNDVSLRDMARRKPLTIDGMRQVHGIGQKKLASFGPRFLELVQAHCGTTE